jgi:hypothetical protein
MKIKLLLIISVFFIGTNVSGQINQPGQNNSVLNSTMNTPNGSYSESVTPMDAPPHRGVVKEAGKYYIEVVVNWMLSSNNTVFYLIKADGKPMDREKITCTAVVQRTDEDDEPQTVKHYGMNAFSTHLKSGEEYHLKITFKKKKKEYSAIFQTSGN